MAVSNNIRSQELDEELRRLDEIDSTIRELIETRGQIVARITDYTTSLSDQATLAVNKISAPAPYEPPPSIHQTDDSTRY